MGEPSIRYVILFIVAILRDIAAEFLHFPGSEPELIANISELVAWAQILDRLSISDPGKDVRLLVTSRRLKPSGRRINNFEGAVRFGNVERQTPRTAEFGAHLLLASTASSLSGVLAWLCSSAKSGWGFRLFGRGHTLRVYVPTRLADPWTPKVARPTPWNFAGTPRPASRPLL